MRVMKIMDVSYDFLGSQVKYMDTDKQILRFAKNNRTAARKAFCFLVVLCELLLRFLRPVGLTFGYIFLKLYLSRII